MPNVLHLRFQVLKAMSIKMTAFWDVVSYSLVAVDRRFIALMMDAVRTSETSVYYNETTRRYIPQMSSSTCYMLAKYKNAKYEQNVLSMCAGITDGCR
jgi:hypothetical protein